MKIRLGIAVALLISLFLPIRSYASGIDESPLETARIERLVALCKLWGAIKYFHPYLGYRDIDWDAALVAAIPKVNAAKNADEYAAAVQNMLDPLGDPATRVVQKTITKSPAKDDRQLTFKLNQDGILVITINNYTEFLDFVAARQKMVAISEELPKARAILFDLRSDGPVPENARGYLSYAFNISQFNSRLSSTPISIPSERTRMHKGFAPQRGATSGDYTSAFFIRDGQKIVPSDGAINIPVVFLINTHSELPTVALALQAAGKGAIVAEGGASDSSIVSTQQIDLSEGVKAEIRLSEVVYEDGSGGLQPDITVPVSQTSGEENQAFKIALGLARDFKPATISRKPIAARAMTIVDRPYNEMSYPSLEYRLLATFRAWNVINYFFPYKDLMGEDWEAVLKEFIPKMEKATNAEQYHLAVAEMVTHIHDTHAFINSPVLRNYFGAAPPPVFVRMIEGVPVVTGFRDEAAAKESGIQIGDTILKVDGEDVKERIARYAKYQTASTPQSLMFYVSNRILAGPDNSTVTVTVRDSADQVKEVKLPRKDLFRQAIKERNGDIIKILPGNIGYADLDRLPRAMVDEMFEKFKDTRAIIFDMRGYPQGTAWAIAPRLTEKISVPAALFQCPTVMSPDNPDSEVKSQLVFSFIQSIPKTDKWRYKGKTVMLIDERTLSQAEHTGLFFESANGTKFIGSHTGGANGDVTNFSVPGGIWINFTGQSVRHLDGRQLQRIGLVPDVEVKPTIKGIQSGKDEVLDKAVEYLEHELQKR